MKQRALAALCCALLLQSGCTTLGFQARFAIYTAPAWALVGGVAVATSQYDSALEVQMPTQCSDLYQFARFPQGLPPNWHGASWQVSGMPAPDPKPPLSGPPPPTDGIPR